MRLFSNIIKVRTSLVLTIVLLCCFDVILNAQGTPPPPAVPIKVVPVIPAMSFGTICDQGTPGGSVIINAQTGSRSPSDVVVFGSYARAEFNIEGNPGTPVIFSYTHNITLLREGGGGSIDMQIDLYPSDWVVLQGDPALDKIYIGGTLTLAGAVPSGTYKSSDFIIIINQP